MKFKAMFTFCTESRYGDYERIEEIATEEGIIFTLLFKVNALLTHKACFAHTFRDFSRIVLQSIHGKARSENSSFSETFEMKLTFNL